MRQRCTLPRWYLIVVIGLIQSSHSHPDCNHDQVIERVIYMCTSYKGSPYSSVKRDTNMAGAEGYNDQTWPGAYHQKQNMPLFWFQTRTPPSYGVFPQQPLPDSSSMAPIYTQQPNSGPFPQQFIPFQQRGDDMQPTQIPNEPEDFASFNNWYLNPVYAGAEGSPVERWRRKGEHISEAIWDFVKKKCCKKGCNYPQDYWELDKSVNICGMR